MRLAGILAPVPTPFDEHDRVDIARLKAAFARWVSSPLIGFVVLGTSGEAVLMDEDESERVIGAARDLVPRDRAFVVGTGRESTQAAIRATKRAAQLGADAVLVRTPGFYKLQMTTEVFVRHYTAVADASPVPVLLYNFTAVTGVNLPLQAVLRLAEHPNVVGMKESGADVAHIADLVAESPSTFIVLAGSSSTFYPALCVGATGGILALATLIPDACVRLLELTRNGRHDEALALQRQIAPIARLVGPSYGVAGLKAALKLAGCDVGAPRLPLVPVPDAGLSAIKEALGRFQEMTT